MHFSYFPKPSKMDNCCYTHTPPLKIFNIFDRSYRNHILGIQFWVERQYAPRRHAPKTLCPETLCPGDTMPRWTLCPSGHYAPVDNMPRWTKCPGGHFAPETTCPEWHYAPRQYAPVDDMPWWSICPGGRHAPLDDMAWWTICPGERYTPNVCFFRIYVWNTFQSFMFIKNNFALKLHSELLKKVNFALTLNFLLFTPSTLFIEM